MKNRPAIILLSESGMGVASEVSALTQGEIHGFTKRVSQVDVSFDNASDHVARLFLDGRTLIGVMASGAMIRLIAPHLSDKYKDPCVLSISDDGSSVVPLLGGHHGGNQMARVIANHLGGFAAVTTVGDVRYGVALDEPPRGWRLSNPMDTKLVMAALLIGESVVLDGDAAEKADWLHNSDLKFFSNNKNETAAIRLTATVYRTSALDKQLVFHPRSLAIGIGCQRGADSKELIQLIEKILIRENLASESISCFCTIDLKADEAAINTAAKYFDVPLRLFDAKVLEQQKKRLKNPSGLVFSKVGCHGVCESSALAAVGNDGVLLVEKVKSQSVTIAVALSHSVLYEEKVGRPRGHLFVVGIGPGIDVWRSPEVSGLISVSSDLVGYSLYLDLLGPLTEGKNRHDFDLGQEESRVRHAMELAGEGKKVSLVCSGDAGIYAMATLVFEIYESKVLSDSATRINIQVSPGISALQAAAAKAGAPLGHDFCTISLSDLLTPWEVIKGRIKAAAQCDFVIAFYNPVSKNRRTQLSHAKDILLEHRPYVTPVILATNLGRQGETVQVISLGDLDSHQVDMLTIVIVGSSKSRSFVNGEGKKWVYTPRGYPTPQSPLLAK
ncbi:precorrin-3B C(17)-methyltransferase [Candidatus Endowatersipora endosymbiont of Watersipora subatra]|uniref:precorrin-3B C(17)-methyltransferase n=1 Tax=Candidatus Endowatersipora endosymbiont of Watersipora subatra TaxID=3077946 RepID=UPI00312CC15C